MSLVWLARMQTGANSSCNMSRLQGLRLTLQSPATPNWFLCLQAWQGMAGHGHGRAWQGMAGHGRAWQGMAGPVSQRQQHQIARQKAPGRELKGPLPGSGWELMLKASVVHPILESSSAKDGIDLLERLVGFACSFSETPVKNQMIGVASTTFSPFCSNFQ